MTSQRLLMEGKNMKLEEVNTRTKEAVDLLAAAAISAEGVLSHAPVIVYGYSLSLELDSRIELLGSCDADSI